MRTKVPRNLQIPTTPPKNFLTPGPDHRHRDHPRRDRTDQDWITGTGITPAGIGLTRTGSPAPGSPPQDKKRHPRRALLDNNVNKSATLQQRGFSIGPDFYRLRDNAAMILPFMGVCKCGKVPYKKYVTIDRNENNVTRFGNVVHCGSVWVCPTCAYKKMKARQEEIRDIFKLHNDSGCSFYFVTLTVKHGKDDPLTVLLNLIQGAWKEITKERKLKPLFHSANFIQTLEIRYSYITGWSPHYHIVFMSDDKNITPLFQSLIKSWIEKTGAQEAGQKVIRANEAKTLSDYILKMDLAFEMTGGQRKTAKKSDSVSYFQMLQKPLKYRKQIEEYAAATKGAKSLRKSKGLKITTDDQEVKDKAITNYLNIDKNVYRSTIVKNCDYKKVLENCHSWEWIKAYFKGFEIDEAEKTIRHPGKNIYPGPAPPG